jgi:SAM-dependent methyltransferase
MDVDWTLVNQAKNLVETQLHQPILKFPIVGDYRQPLADFIQPESWILDIGANDRALKSYLEDKTKTAINYRSMDIDRSHVHDFYSFDEMTGNFDAISCFEVVEHMPPGMALQLFHKAYSVLKPGGRMFVSTPNVYHPMSFWSDASHITPYRIRHLAGWMATVGFENFWGYRVARVTWKQRWRYWRYRGLLRLLNLDFAPGILVVGEKKL